MTDEERNRQIYILRNSGMSLASLGIQFHISKERVRQIYIKEKRIYKMQKEHEDALNNQIPYNFLDAIIDACDTEMQITRIYRCLNRAGIIQAIDLGLVQSLDRYTDDFLLSIRNFGSKSLILARKANDLYKEKLGIDTKE